MPPRITLADAIEAGRLVPYEYFPHPLNLTAEEADEWRSYTEKHKTCRSRWQKPDDVGVQPLSDTSENASYTEIQSCQEGIG